MKVESTTRVTEITITLSQKDAEDLEYLLGWEIKNLSTTMRDLYNGLTIALRKTHG